MIAAMTVAVLFAGSLPALLPRWRQVAIGVRCVLGLPTFASLPGGGSPRQ